MIGLFNTCRALTGLVGLIFVATYITKFLYFKQPVDTWASWKWDDEFFAVAPFIAAGTGVIVCCHYGFMLTLKCVPLCQQRRPRGHEFVALSEV